MRAAPAPPGMTAEFLRPFTEERVSCPVHYLSFIWMCISAPDGPHLKLDQRITKIDILQDDEQVALISARMGFVAGGLMVIQVDTIKDEEERYHELVRAAMYPDTRGSPRTQALWRLCIDSGLFSLIKKAPQVEFQRLRPAYEWYSSVLEGAKPLGRRVAFFRDGVVKAALEVNKLTRLTHIISGLAKLQDYARTHDRGASLVSSQQAGIEHFMRHDPEAEHFMALVEQNHHTRRTFKRYNSVFREAGLSDMQPMHLIRVVLERFRRSEPRFEVRRANKDEVARLCDKIKAKRPGWCVKAMGWTPEEMELREVQHQVIELGGWRERKVLTAVEGSEVVAYAIVESGAEGASWYSIQDCVELFGTGRSTEGFAELLMAAADYFKAQNKRVFNLAYFYRDWHWTLRMNCLYGGRGWRWLVKQPTHYLRWIADQLPVGDYPVGVYVSNLSGSDSPPERA